MINRLLIVLLLLGSVFAEKSRFTVKGYEWLSDGMETIDLKKVKKLSEISNSIGISQSQLAILWCLKNKNVSTVILGASNTKQLKENLQSIEHHDKLSKSVMTKIHKLF